MEFILSMVVCAVLGACIVAGLMKELAAYSPARFSKLDLFKF